MPTGKIRVRRGKGANQGNADPKGGGGQAIQRVSV